MTVMKEQLMKHTLLEKHIIKWIPYFYDGHSIKILNEYMKKPLIHI